MLSPSHMALCKLLLFPPNLSFLPFCQEKKKCSFQQRGNKKYLFDNSSSWGQQYSGCCRSIYIYFFNIRWDSFWKHYKISHLTLSSLLQMITLNWKHPLPECLAHKVIKGLEMVSGLLKCRAAQNLISIKKKKKETRAIKRKRTLDHPLVKKKKDGLHSFFPLQSKQIPGRNY